MMSSLPEFRLYNSLARRVEPFAPSDGDTVRMYACGPTVYNPAHLGNFRTFLFEDLLRRTLALRGWRVLQVMNLTDVDDKIIKKAAAAGQQIAEVTEPYSALFHEDRRYLRIQDAEVYPKATEHIPEMIALVETLVHKGVAYVADDGSVYFAIDRFADYGKLSQLDKREIRVGARVAQDEYAKDNAQDFALWKSAKPEDEATGAAWDSPWGRGRPGWHLECSAMAMKYLGETLDLHAGGIDLIFPHHEDEIAQSEAATGKPFARCWCHGEFLLTDGAKMAKRIGNVANVADLRAQEISGAVYRHFVFNAHYRKQLNLTEDSLEQSMAAVRRIGHFAERLRNAPASAGTAAMREAARTAEQAFIAALFDDLNAPESLAALFTFIADINRELDRARTSSASGAAGGAVGGAASGAASGTVDGTNSVAHTAVDPDALAEARRVFALMDSVLDLVPEQMADDTLAAWVEERLAARRAARIARDFATADAIRAELTDRGIEVEDTAAGTSWRKF
jgi:cysteinyl-tRNA synthetase